MLYCDEHEERDNAYNARRASIARAALTSVAASVGYYAAGNIPCVWGAHSAFGFDGLSPLALLTCPP